MSRLGKNKMLNIIRSVIQEFKSESRNRRIK